MNHSTTSIVTAALIITTLTTAAYGDWTFKHDPHHKGRPIDIESRLIHMKSELQLTDMQVTEIKRILERYAHKKTKRDLRPSSDRIVNIREMESKIKAILTTEQLEKYEKFKASMKQKNKAEIQSRVLEKMKLELDLTDEQTQRVSTVLTTFQNEMILIMNSDPKQSEIRDKSKAARERRASELKQILTPGQWEQLQTIKTQRPPHGYSELPSAPRV